jgi:hypothetical protein
MATILVKKRDTTGAPATGDLTNSAGGAEIAVNTFDKRLYAKDSGGTVVEIGTDPATFSINSAYTFPTLDGTANYFLQTDGAGALSFAEAATPAGTQTLTNKTISGASNTVTVDGTDAVGFRNTPVNSQSADYTAVLADSGKTILHAIADDNARTFTIPANASVAYPVGTVLTFINLINTVTIAITSDTMYLGNDGATGSRTLAAYGVASAIKVSSTVWIISGNGLT